MALFLIVAPLAAMADGDTMRGQQLFGQCSGCHDVDGEASRSASPSLRGFLDKPAATNIPDYEYSEALKTSGLVWTEEVLDLYIEDPAALVPGTTMDFAGITNAAKRADIIAYLRQGTR